MNELGGILFGGGLVLASSLVFAKNGSETLGSEPSQPGAENYYNKIVDDVSKNGGENSLFILAPKFGGDSYAGLKKIFAKSGITMITHPSKQYATIDLTPLIAASPTFNSERALHACLVEHGIVLSPGEAHGLTEPGFFRICCPMLTTKQCNDIGAAMVKVMTTFVSPKPEKKRASPVLTESTSTLSNEAGGVKKRQRS